MKFRAEGFKKIAEVVTGVSVQSLTDEQMASIDHLLDSIFPNEDDHPRNKQAECLRCHFGLYSEPMSSRQLRQQFRAVNLNQVIPELQEKAIQEFVQIFKLSVPKKELVGIKELGLPTRVVNIIRWKKIETAEQLSRWSAKDLLSLENIGRQSIILMNQKLCILGYDPIR